MRKTKKGISLIVLVITIIVMIILAATIILAINNNNVVDKAKDAVNDTNLKQIQELAQILWADAYVDGVRTQEELEDAVLEGLKDTDISKYTITVTTSGVDVTLKEEKPTEPEIPEEPTEPEGPVTHSGTIPKGAVYYVGVEGTSNDYATATATYTEGDPFPETMNTGDIYVYGDYEYRYNMAFVLFGWGEVDNQTGWGVLRRDASKVEYEPVLDEINDEPLTMMSCTYIECNKMVVPPEIPETVIIMSYGFHGCEALTIAPILPENIEMMACLFYSCSSLKTYVGSSEQDGYFSNYVIPTNVINMNHAFSNCVLLKTTPNWSNNIKIKEMTGVMSGCTSLNNVAELPNGVEKLDYAFSGCTSLVTAPIISSSVKNISATFENCTNLTGTVTINATPDDYFHTFYQTTKSIKIAGSCPLTIKQEIAAETSNVTY